MALGRFIFKSEDPELQHITLSLEIGISSYQQESPKPSMETPSRCC